MNGHNKPVQLAWRATAAEGGSAENAEQDARGRVLLLVGPGGNRERLAEHLRLQHDVLEPAGDVFPQEGFDLAVVDAAGFRQWHQQLMDVKTREEPTFLPVMLVLSRRDLRYRLRAFWDFIDEFVIAPIDRSEFTERVAMLLRARRLAVAQRAHLAYLVNHDRATGLPNKNLFMDRLVNAVREASVLDKSVYVTMVRLPLSRILKSLGHHGLERAAVNCSTRLRALLGNDVSLSRLTTEEWGLVHQPGTPMTDVIEICSRVQRLADEPVHVGNERIHLAPRIAVAQYPEDASDAAGTLDCAMSALSEASGTEPVFYSRNVQQQALRFIRTEAHLHEALEKEQFELWFQPQLRLADRGMVGVEALVRWRLPGGELVPPGDFMAVAEASGLISRIDRWVLESACRTMRAWRASGAGIERVAVNVSAEDIKDSDFADFVIRTLERYELPPSSLELELTETTLFEISAENLEKLDRLRDYGISIAVDDFGTGYSSLSYLHKLPITTLKIDKAFVDNVNSNTTNEAITRTIVWLAKNFGLETVAEGIETEEQATYLRTMDVVTGQGFLYARPMPEKALREWLLART
ncbi:MAG TPA: EAL domain-containing protein [Gammaproteobacteria bacterium]